LHPGEQHATDHDRAGYRDMRDNRNEDRYELMMGRMLRCSSKQIEHARPRASVPSALQGAARFR
jgi:hypothetical protein